MKKLQRNRKHRDMLWDNGRVANEKYSLYTVKAVCDYNAVNFPIAIRQDDKNR